jgi:DNA-binding beta-propeller fold protein YncE
MEPEPIGMALTHDGKLLIVAADRRVVFLDVAVMIAGTGDAVLGSIAPHGGAGDCFDVNVTADDRLLFVSEESAAAITVIDLERARKAGYYEDAILGSIPVGLAPVSLTFSLDDKWLYTTSERALPQWMWPPACTREGSFNSEIVEPQGAVVVVDVDKARRTPSDAVVGRIPAACSPVRAAISPEGSRLFVTARNSNAVVVFDTAKLLADSAHAQVGFLRVGESPIPLAVIDAGTRLLVGNSNRFARPTPPGTLTVLDTTRLERGARAEVGVVDAGVYPREMCVSPDGGTVFLTNWGSDVLQVINVKHLPLLAH